MFGMQVVCYLFLGGAGAAAIALAALVDLIWLKEPFGAASRASVDEAGPAERVAAFGLLAGFAALAFGALCLVFDLGRLDRVLALLLNPTLTHLSVGTFALAALGVCGAFLVAMRFLYLPAVPRGVVAAVEAASVALAVVVVAYTGLLLQGVGGVALWRSPLVPALFVLSSASCGIAILFAASCAVESEGRAVRLAHVLLRVDAVVIVLEAAAAALFAGLALADGHPGVVAPMQRLVEGDLATLWWLGFVGCGLIAPLAVELGVERRGPSARRVLVAAAVLVLVGGFCLRAGIVEAGAHRELALESVLPQQTYDQAGAQALRSQ